MAQANSQQLGITLDVKLTFKEHLSNVNKVNKTIGLLRKLHLLYETHLDAVRRLI